MLLTPRYDDPTFFRFELPMEDLRGLVTGQRDRLAATLAGLDDAQWSAPSRCDAWSVRDVVSHLATTNGFWAFAIAAALAGEPTRVLSSFDPVTTPADLVDATRSQPPAEVLDQFVAGNRDLEAALASLGDGDWDTLAEAPHGHVPIRALALHALWDSWVHERDIVLPLGLPAAEEPDEVAACLRYVAALGPAFVVGAGSGRPGAIAVDASDPEVRFVVDVGASVTLRGGDAPEDALVLTGGAVDLTEGLSMRCPLPCEVPADRGWLLGLAGVFDQDL
jgi:uncharacterized protein (TIGR03083 family)